MTESPAGLPAGDFFIYRGFFLPFPTVAVLDIMIYNTSFTVE